jgi:hypothetical protein
MMTSSFRNGCWNLRACSVAESLPEASVVLVVHGLEARPYTAKGSRAHQMVVQ